MFVRIARSRVVGFTHRPRCAHLRPLLTCGGRLRAVAAIVVVSVAFSGLRSAPAAPRARAISPFATGCAVSPVVITFPAYNPLSTNPSTFSGSLTLTCTVLLAFGTVALGTGNSNSFSPRLMYSGNNTIAYNLYQDSGYTTIWGDGSGTTKTENYNLLFGGSETLPIYGNVPGGQNVQAGTYTDGVSVTVTLY